ncbi:Hpt domain-containing protein [Cyanobium gracile]|uniref:Hpt domain-containing protein n=1 Tax=Cyanobium gracile UHCC 0281 TaxID=3110309 RepID=A0ABU5SZ46_9CYAN|nr:Hpt domain-containing protein [Cyanobium gracile]MEA5443726.1 Hpt domain-containing protein [Cyanobium gracile UHCC 0281]
MAEFSDPIDLQAWEALRAIGGSDADDMMNELITFYEEDSAALIASIRRCSHSLDLNELRAAAHALRSPSATLGALGLAELCRRLELASSSDDLSSVNSLIDELLVVHERVLSSLRAMRTDQ